jgi:hypothetical protein
MTFTPPFTLTGEAGKALGAEGYSLAALGVQDAVLSLRSLDADTLQFTLRDNGSRPAIPEDGQWITLKDDAGQVLFTGIAKRSFAYPARVYSYTVSNVYKGMMETPLLGDDDRPFLLYSADEIGKRLRDVILRAGNTGLPVQAPSEGEMPEYYLVPKMAFRAANYASALEDMLKWAPDTVTRMDYSTTPPTLRFASRADATVTVIDLDAEGHKTTGLELSPYPEARALGITLAYARRDGDSQIISISQNAGDPQAEASRKLSVFLSGVERSDLLISEALTNSQLAVIKVNELIVATGATVDAAAASAALSLNWATCLAEDSTLLAANTAQSDFVMTDGAGYRSYYNQIYDVYDFGPQDTSRASYSGTGLHLATSTGAAATGWYAIKDGAFTAAQLTTAGALKETRYIKGQLVADRTGSTARNVGMQSLWNAAPSQCNFINGYLTNNYNSNFETLASKSRCSLWYRVNLPVDAINMSPSAVAAAVKAATAGNSASAFVERAEFVEAPPELAANYFGRQDWTPYKGSLTLAPSAVGFPAPGDFLSITGDGVPAEWETMKVPVSELSLDLRTGAATVAIGPSPRMDFSSLVDRLRIPPEDNYQPG